MNPTRVPNFTTSPHVRFGLWGRQNHNKRSNDSQKGNTQMNAYTAQCDQYYRTVESAPTFKNPRSWLMNKGAGKSLWGHLASEIKLHKHRLNILKPTEPFEAEMVKWISNKVSRNAQEYVGRLINLYREDPASREDLNQRYKTFYGTSLPRSQDIIELAKYTTYRKILADKGYPGKVKDRNVTSLEFNLQTLAVLEIMIAQGNPLVFFDERRPDKSPFQEALDPNRVQQVKLIMVDLNDQINHYRSVYHSKIDLGEKLAQHQLPLFRLAMSDQMSEDSPKRKQLEDELASMETKMQDLNQELNFNNHNLLAIDPALLLHDPRETLANIPESMKKLFDTPKEEAPAPEEPVIEVEKPEPQEPEPVPEEDSEDDLLLASPSQRSFKK